MSVITKISYELWDIISITLPKEKPNNTIGRPAIPFRKVLDGIVYVLRPAVNGSLLTKIYGSGSTCHRRFQEWTNIGFFKRIWIRLLKEYDSKIGIKWTWQYIDNISLA